MDLTPVLINSSQSDPRLREAADAQLAQFAQANMVRPLLFSVLLGALSKSRRALHVVRT